MALLEVRHLKKTYTNRFGTNQVQALRDVSFTIEEGEFTAVMGGIRIWKDDAVKSAGLL